MDDKMKAAFEKWVSDFKAIKPEPMSSDNAEVFLVCNMAEGDPAFPPDEFKGQFLYQVISKRAEYLKLRLTDSLKTFLCALTRSPGSAVMFIAILYAMFEEEDKLISMNDLTSLFPWGFPSEASLGKAWDAQKGYVLGLPVDNLLDHIGG